MCHICLRVTALKTVYMPVMRTWTNAGVSLAPINEPVHEKNNNFRITNSS